MDKYIYSLLYNSKKRTDPSNQKCLEKMLIDDENSGQEAQLTLFNTHRRFSCSARINLPSVKCTSLGIKHKEMGASIRLAKTSLCLDAIKAAGYLWKQLCTEIWVSNIEARDFWERSDRNGQQRGTVFWGRGER